MLRLAEIDIPGQAKGTALRRVISVHASDGCLAAFALAEIDPAIGDEKVYEADRSGGKALGRRDGAWRLVVPSKQRTARWVRQVVRLVVTKAP